ncbi:MAG: DUF1887 family CARF protein [Chthoniobacteraceae bacterium]|jgi:hypothetical protein
MQPGPSIILALASKQIWPHVLTVTAYKPQRLILLHSDDERESRLPAQRLKKFFEKQNLVSPGAVSLREIPDDDFHGVEREIAAAVRELSIPPSECALNFTGGNKLMAAAAFHFAIERGLNAIYLERRNSVTWFMPGDKSMATRTDTLDAHQADGIDPVALLRCQIDASEVEREGEMITLNERGAALALEDFRTQAESGTDMLPFLSVRGEADRDAREGDPLEYAAAAVVLKLGVSQVRRSLRLKVRSTAGVSTRVPHAEIDLLFNFGGHLWIVDCKDRKPAADLLKPLDTLLKPHLKNSELQKHLARLRDQLSISETKALKEDLLAIREAGGLLGKVVCVRKSEPPDEVKQFARHNQIEIIPKRNMFFGWQSLLFPDRPPDAESLAGLLTAFHS